MLRFPEPLSTDSSDDSSTVYSELSDCEPPLPESETDSSLYSNPSFDSESLIFVGKNKASFLFPTEMADETPGSTPGALTLVVAAEGVVIAAAAGLAFKWRNEMLSEIDELKKMSEDDRKTILKMDKKVDKLELRINKLEGKLSKLEKSKTSRSGKKKREKHKKSSSSESSSSSEIQEDDESSKEEDDIFAVLEKEKSVRKR